MRLDERFASFWKQILIFEGGYSDDKDDSGGKTKYGISQKSFPKVDIEKLDKTSAMMLAQENYYDELSQSLPIRLAFVYFDSAFNCGKQQAVKFLQRALNNVYKTNLKDDGIIGEKTKTALKLNSGTCFECEISQEMLFQRLKYYFDITNPANPRHKKNIKFLRGWIKRLCDINLFLMELRYKI